MQTWLSAHRGNIDDPRLLRQAIDKLWQLPCFQQRSQEVRLQIVGAQRAGEERRSHKPKGGSPIHQ
jgi:hypothetical protein